MTNRPQPAMPIAPVLCGRVRTPALCSAFSSIVILQGLAVVLAVLELPSSQADIELTELHLPLPPEPWD